MINKTVQYFLFALLVSFVVNQAIIIRNSGCKTFDSNGQCKVCSTRYYLDIDYICQPVNPQCLTYDSSNGACLSCYPGFGVLEGTCLPGLVTKTFDSNCNTFNGSICIKCSSGYFINQKGICQAVSPSCKTFNPSNGACTSCFPGFDVQIDGTCQIGKAIATIANCNQMDSNGNCLKCSFGYYFNQNKQCIQIDPNCKDYNQTSYKCVGCYPGFALDISGSCVKGEAPIGDQNCAKYNSNNVCTQCSKGSIFNKNNVCITIDPSCLTYDQNTGACLTCYPGYEINGLTCVVSAIANNTNPYCSKWQGNKCQTCAFGSFFDNNGICVVTDPNCKTTNNNICTSCYPGYDLTNSNTCTKSVNNNTSNPHCSKWENGICTQCPKGAYFNSQNICSLVNPLCFTYDSSNGNCLSCYIGYSLSGDTCVVSNSTTMSDPNCKRFNNQTCAQCSFGYYMGKQNRCKQANPFCKTYDPQNGNCTSCFPGYAIAGINCTQSVQSISDPNCKSWNQSVCIECSFGAYFGVNNICTLADPLCKTFNSTNGNCLTCFDSFELQGSKCVKSNQTLSDPNCAQFLQGICMQCSSGFVFSPTGICQLVSTDCKTFDSVTGFCLSCFQGYALVNNKCVKGDSTNNYIDPNCASFTNNVCVKCSKNYYFGIKGLCILANPLCQTFDPTNGKCLTCFQSYVLNKGECIIDANNTATDPNCASWLDGICVLCAPRTFINSKGLCENVNINCGTYKITDGSCTSCYPGFDLANGVCSVSNSPSSCSKFDSKGACLNCSQGSYLNSGRCIQIDPQCAFFDYNQLQCTSCYSGYAILNGVCQISVVDSKSQIQNCYAYDQQKNCIKCYSRYYLSSNTCQQVDMFCKTYDDATGGCTSCFTTFTLLGGKCTQNQ